MRVKFGPKRGNLLWCISFGMLNAKSVFTPPGWRAKLRTPCFPYSVSMNSVKRQIANLVVWYALAPYEERCPPLLDMLMICLLLPSFKIKGRNERTVR